MTYDAASLINQAMASAISRGLAGATDRHPVGEPFQPVGVARVLVDPGAHHAGRDADHAHDRRAATSCASPIVSASTPALEAAYCTYSPGDPSVAAAEAHVDQHAARLRRRNGRARRTAARATYSAEDRLRSTVRWITAAVGLGERARVQRRARVVDHAGELALLRGLREQPLDLGGVGDVAGHGRAAPADLLDLRAHVGRRSRVGGRSRAPGRGRRPRAGGRWRRRCRGCRR